MKYTFQIRTEDFEYIMGAELETNDPYVAVTEYQRLKEAFKDVAKSDGMTEAELDLWVENMLLEKGNNADVYKKATPAQAKELHRIKRAISRIKSRKE